MRTAAFQLTILWRLLAMQLRGQWQYRASALFDILTTAISTLTVFVSLVLIFEQFENLRGWSVGEVAFLFGMVETAFGIMDMLFSGFDPDQFGQFVRRGQFDQLLLRPVSVSLQVLGSRLLIRRLGRVLQGLIVLAIALQLVNFNWTLAKVVYFPFVLFGMVCFFGALFVVGSAITFWTLESIEVINIFTYGGAEMISYPMTIYQDWMQRFFTYIIPAIFLNYYPALFFLERPEAAQASPLALFAAPLVGFATLFAASLFWRFAIRHYQSTGT